MWMVGYDDVRSVLKNHPWSLITMFFENSAGPVAYIPFCAFWKRGVWVCLFEKNYVVTTDSSRCSMLKLHQVGTYYCVQIFQNGRTLVASQNSLSFFRCGSRGFTALTTWRICFHVKPSGAFSERELIWRYENFPQRTIISFSSVNLVYRTAKESKCCVPLWCCQQNLQYRVTLGLSVRSQVLLNEPRETYVSLLSNYYEVLRGVCGIISITGS